MEHRVTLRVSRRATGPSKMGSRPRTPLGAAENRKIGDTCPGGFDDDGRVPLLACPAVDIGAGVKHCWTSQQWHPKRRQFTSVLALARMRYDSPIPE